MGLILLVRHGQASTGSADYDRLSPLGEQQATVVGNELRARGIAPARVVSGALRRQRQTADFATAAAFWPVTRIEDPRWNEFNHTEVISAADSTAPAAVSRAQSNLDHAIPRWSSGLHDDEYLETYSAF